MANISVGLIVLTDRDGGILTREPSIHALAEGISVQDALLQLGWDEANCSALLASRSVAVFGKYALADTILVNGDRLEILSPLQFDPKESRRRRAEHKKHHMPGQKKRERMSGRGNSGNQS